MFHILKLLYYNFIINITKNVFPYVYNQVVIQLLITHSTTWVILQYPHSFCGYGTHLIGAIKCDISTIICDVGTIQCDIGTIWFFIYINLNNK